MTTPTTTRPASRTARPVPIPPDVLDELRSTDDAGRPAVAGTAFADPEVALVHVRAVEYGCFLYEVRRR